MKYNTKIRNDMSSKKCTFMTSYQQETRQLDSTDTTASASMLHLTVPKSRQDQWEEAILFALRGQNLTWSCHPLTMQASAVIIALPD